MREHVSYMTKKKNLYMHDEDLSNLLDNLLESDNQEFEVNPVYDEHAPVNEKMNFLEELDFDYLGQDYISNHIISQDDYASTQSSDSGKHSPSSSEGTSDVSPWSFPSCEASTSLNIPMMESPAYSVEQGIQQPQQHGSPIYNLPAPMSNESNYCEVTYESPRIHKDMRNGNGIPSRPVMSHTSSASVSSAAPPAPLYLGQLKPIAVMPSTGIRFVNYTVDPEEEEFHRKQEERKMKNRAAAQASRIRKKCDFDGMRTKLCEFEAEIIKLKAENADLKKRLEKYEGQNATLTSASLWPSGPPRKRGAILGACFLAVVMVVSFSGSEIQLNRYNGTNIRQSVAASDKIRPIIGRSIQTDEDYDVQALEAKLEELVATNSSNGGCLNHQGWLNKTETIRLNTDLDNWVDRHEKMEMIRFRRGSGKKMMMTSTVAADLAKNFNQRINLTESEINMNRKNDQLSKKKEPRQQRRNRDKSWQHLDRMISQSRDKLRSPPVNVKSRGNLNETYANGKIKPALMRAQYEQLTAAIQKDPTILYILTMKDYFLLPPLTRNSTSRPRLSFLLPAPPQNGIFSNQVPMIRIECEVTGTGMFNISAGLLPVFFN